MRGRQIGKMMTTPNRIAFAPAQKRAGSNLDAMCACPSGAGLDGHQTQDQTPARRSEARGVVVVRARRRRENRFWNESGGEFLAGRRNADRLAL